MTESLKPWVLSEISSMERIGDTPLNLYKKTLGSSHEITRHRNCRISYLLDRLLTDKTMKSASSFYQDAKGVEDFIDIELVSNAKDIVLWSNNMGEHKGKPNIAFETDILDDYIGYGVEWSDDHKHINYVKSKKAVVALHRTPQDANGLKFRQSSSYPSFNREDELPDVITIDKTCDGHDMVKEMMATQAYKHARTDAQRRRLLSYVRDPGNIQKSIPMNSDFSNRKIKSSPSIDQYIDRQLVLNNIQRDAAGTQSDYRQVNLDLTADNPGNQYN